MEENHTNPAKAAVEEYRQRMHRHRTAKGLTHAALAMLLPASESLVGAVERGTRPPTEGFTRALEKALGLEGELLELLPAIRSLAPRWFRKWPAIEASAQVIRTYELALIPGLLQTEDYARAIFNGEPSAVPQEAEKRVQIRLRRQAILSRTNPPAASFIVDESALRRQVGGREVMRAQLQYLLDTMTRPCITVRVVPLSSGATAGLIAPFVIAQVDTETVGFLENAESGEVANHPDMIQCLSERWELLSGLAQPTYETKKIIREVMEHGP
ncbi:XRE family transcriptional regulator [Nonomuraea mesophila]|uniref:XRE family transcriptional regulator n=1 Tax=Nonomuraea mesophila TaxID=2530382 RepID=A0A4R5FU59_9ACTN|nr:helix-turn-helix transcriptional regulator [Nonomuraea mesophila]TDE56840.1 XRE family transcriptional regulator [Nonomuraea mesophila]